MQYLECLREKVPVSDIILFWDVFSAHGDKEVKA
jgi:hypothetical protein